jgi:hypothetical protein
LLKKKVVDEHVIGDDVPKKQSNTPVFHRSPSKTTTEEIKEEHFDDDMAISEHEELSKRIYNSIVDQMILSIMNSSFSDIRVRTNLQSTVDAVIDASISKMVAEIARKSLVYAKEEEECRQIEIKAYEQKMQADLEKREKERNDRLLRQKAAVQSIDIEIEKVYDRYVQNQVFSVVTSSIRSYQTELYNEASLSSASSLISTLIPPTLTNIVNECIIESKSANQEVIKYSHKLSVNK